MANNFGIENLKLLIKFPLSLTKELTEDFADGKLSFGEQLGLITQIIQAAGIVKAWPEIKKELADLTAAEKKELRTWVVSQFSLDVSVKNAAIDKLVKSSLAFAVAGWELVEGWKNINKLL